jgi:hypothetical protein
MVEPPDWNSPQASEQFYADDAQICRFLQLADATAAAELKSANVTATDFERYIGQLDHNERRLAQLAILNLLRLRCVDTMAQRMRLLGMLFVLHPARAARLLWKGIGAATAGQSVQPSH